MSLVQQLGLSGYWINFDEFNQKISGVFDSGSLRGLLQPGVTQVRLAYVIQIGVTDKTGLSAHAEFSLFLENRSPLVAPPTIQKQFDDKLRSAGVLEKFEFQISQKSFLDQDADTLHYQIYMIDAKGEKVISPPWLIIDLELLAISGTPPLSLLWSSIALRISAQDNLFHVSQVLEIRMRESVGMFVNAIPKIIGPILTVIACFSYRGWIYEILCKKRYVNRLTYKAECGYWFYLAIPFIQEELQKQKLVLRLFKRLVFAYKKSNARKRQHWIFLYYNTIDRSFSFQSLESDLNALFRTQIKGLFQTPEKQAQPAMSEKSKFWSFGLKPSAVKECDSQKYAQMDSNQEEPSPDGSSQGQPSQPR